MMLSLYRFVSAAGVPLIRLYLGLRKARGKEDPARFNERLGHPGKTRPEGPLVWAHAASVGESLSLLPLVERLVKDRPSLIVLVTTGTLTSSRLMAERLPDGAVHQFVPVDRVSYVRRFLDHWHPDLALWVESEFWPNLIIETAGRNIPMILINGRISPRSFLGWQRFGGLIKKLLSCFALCLAQADADAERLLRLGAVSAKYVGNLKFSAPPLPADADELSNLQDAVGDRPRWLAASTHPGEEIIVAGVHQRLAGTRPELLTVIVPRHPDRGTEIAAMLRGQKLAVSRRSDGDAIGPQTDIYLADTVGEMGLFFRLAGVVFMGKSLVPLGGQNPLEAARLDCAIVYGPHMMNFDEMTKKMKNAAAALEVADEGALETVIGRLLDDGVERGRMIAAAGEWAVAEAGVLDAVVAELAPFLATLSKENAPRARA